MRPPKGGLDNITYTGISVWLFVTRMRLSNTNEARLRGVWIIRFVWYLVLDYIEFLLKSLWTILFPCEASKCEDFICSISLLSVLPLRSGLSLRHYLVLSGERLQKRSIVLVIILHTRTNINIFYACLTELKQALKTEENICKKNNMKENFVKYNFIYENS